MKRILLITLLLFCALQLSFAQTRVLFLGNSYTYGNNLPQLFTDLSTAGGHSVHVDVRASGGEILAGHATNAVTLDKIRFGNWDYVILQEQSQIPTIPFYRDGLMYPAAGQLKDSIRAHNPCASLMFFMTWGRRFGGQQCDIAGDYCSPVFTDFEHMQDSLASAYQHIADELHAQLSPVGRAWQYALEHDPSLVLHTGDNSHAMLSGSYLAACTFYAMIFDETPVGNTFTAGQSAALAGYLQEAADITVRGSGDPASWNRKIDELNADFSWSVGGGSVLNLTPEVTGKGNLSYSWDFGDGNTSTSAAPVHTYASPGNYLVTLTVTNDCGETDTHSEMTVTNCLTDWNTLSNITANPGGTLSKTVASNGWNSGAITSNVLPADTDGSISMTVTDIGQFFMFGLSSYNPDVSFKKIDHAYFHRYRKARIYEKGRNKGNFGTHTVGDVLKVAREGNQVVYYRNGTPLYSTTVNPSIKLYGKVAIWKGSSDTPEFDVDFCPSFDMDYTLSHSSCASNDGEISLTALGGTAPYNYTWSTGQTTATISGLGVGNYNVTVTDASGLAWNESFTIANEITWDVTDVVVTGSDLSKSAPDGAWNAGAISDNALPASTDGWVEFRVGDKNDFAMVGLSTYNTSISFSSIDFALFLRDDIIRIYESGINRGNFGSVETGDLLRVAREGNEIKYYHNGSPLRTITTSPSDILHADISIYKGDLQNVVASFCGPASPTASYNNSDPLGDVAETETSGTEEEAGRVVEREINNALSRLVAYPNPTEGILHVVLNASEIEGEVSFTMLDMLGRKIAEQHFEKTGAGLKATFDISSYPSGTYLIQVVSKQGTEVLRVVKN